MSIFLGRASIRGEKGEREVTNLPTNPEAFFTDLPSDVLVGVGASAEPLKVRLQMDDGGCIESEVPSLEVSALGRQGIILAITFEGAQPVLGVKFLEDLALRVNSETGRLEPARHRGFAYNLEP